MFEAKFCRDTCVYGRPSDLSHYLTVSGLTVSVKTAVSQFEFFGD